MRYSNLSYRSPVYEGDVTYVNAEVKELHKESAWGAPLVQLEVTMTNQDNAKLASGRVDVELPP
jgi:acyl-CoA thioesterase FadM